MAGVKKNMLFVFRRPPYGTSLARAALDAALATATFEQPLKLLFLGDGVLQLLPGQDSAPVGARNIGKLLGSLPLYDIEQIYVERKAAEEYALDLNDSPVPAIALESEGIRQLMIKSDHILGF